MSAGALWRDLVDEYLCFKQGLRAGKRKRDLSDMTDREQAGLWLKTFGEGALAQFDSAPKTMDPWPDARSLIERALQGSTS